MDGLVCMLDSNDRSFYQWVAFVCKLDSNDCSFYNNVAAVSNGCSFYQWVAFVSRMDSNDMSLKAGKQQSTDESINLGMGWGQ